MSKEMQLIIDAQAEKMRQTQVIEDLRSLKETLRLSTQQAMDALKIPTEQQAQYAGRV